MKTQFSHVNVYSNDLDKSVRFYEEALGFKVLRTKKVVGREMTLVFMGADDDVERIELMNTPQYIAGTGSELNHLAICVDDMEEARALHEKMGCIQMVNEKAGLYYIADPDGNWIEILPPARWING